jgi:hypothetical protein
MPVLTAYLNNAIDTTVAQMQAALYGTPTLVAGDATINANQSQIYILNKGSAAAITLGAPTVTTSDGVTITITSNSAFAHVITATGLFQSGAAGVNTCTFAAHAGATVTLYAYQGKWNWIASVAATAG